ncbi:arginine--tRNA ligase [Pontibacillus litoralis]|uniref:Arginine--tRNA ligase n=1 Tax=Pontibacillus litoralis JSM 072002 TaxID=1385512 RepID=A0A0A5FZP1_9BACI|nr:arginine--tRNA ligase [Pontibacillus litoralis]KGX84303.1 arginyl-tRNA synthase [Pontibacillus litoralis JSM 072002]
MNYKLDFSALLFEALDGKLEKNKLFGMIEKPKYSHLGDLAFPCFELSKQYRKPPQTIAIELANKIESPLFEKVEAIGGYLNVFLEKQPVSNLILVSVINKKNHYGTSKVGNGDVVTIDFSSPNIAKPFSMGHLRSTVIGNAIALMLDKCGFKPVRINYLGDWGTQFGKLIVAYKLWGNEHTVRENPIKELLKLYVKFHEEAEINPQLNEKGREWFKKLEEADEEAISLWEWFKGESLKEFSKIYDLLGISFDSYNGEAFFNDKMENIVEILKEKSLLETSDGAQVVTLNEKGLPPCLIKKRDETTLYATRDLAAALYRQNTYNFSKSLYIVGNEQSLHFNQVFAVLEKMEYQWHNGLAHIPFGMILKEGKKMSTRKGKVVLLEDVLNEAIWLAEQNILTKNPNLKSKKEVASAVGTGAIIFHDLKHFRQNDIEFSLHEMLKFEGETGPYVQYTHARAFSLLRKGQYEEDINSIQIKDQDNYTWEVIINLMEFPEVIEKSMESYDPSQIAKYLIELSRSFNKYYSSVRILDDELNKHSRLSLVHSVTIVLKEGLRLLGIKAPEEM